MSFFTGTTKLSNTSAIPAGEDGHKVTKKAAVALLQNHDFFLKAEPHFVSYRALPPNKPANNDGDTAAVREAYSLPVDLEPLGHPKVKLYEVIDHVPNPVWSSSVVSTEEFVDLKDGLWVRIHSPLAVVMETKWTVREREAGAEGEGDGGLELVEDVEISCSKLLLSIVKGQVENNWRGIHDNIIKKLLEDAKNGGK
ncbi:hypothetical protein F4806DRAFT_459079 [Annulohypoxylon nitens]|nr:hypothetical protein F4806DRAFT_459079 [Annulohypoxylon nitens]